MVDRPGEGSSEKDCDWRFDKLSRSNLQSQVNSVWGFKFSFSKHIASWYNHERAVLVLAGPVNMCRAKSSGFVGIHWQRNELIWWIARKHKLSTLITTATGPVFMRALLSDGIRVYPSNFNNFLTYLLFYHSKCQHKLREWRSSWSQIKIMF